jgi:type I restriction enzyme, S subunit
MSERPDSVWRSATVRELCLRVTSGGTPSRRRPDYFADDGVPWVKTQELLDRVLYDTAEHITEQAIQESSAKLLPTGTLLVAMYGATAGQLGLLGRPMTCNQACCALIVDEEKANKRFLYYALRDKRTHLKSLANGAAQQNLNARMIASLVLSVAPLRVQDAIAEVLGALDDKIECNLHAAQIMEDLAVALVARLDAAVDLSVIAQPKGRQIKTTDFGTGMIDHFSLPAFDAAALPEYCAGASIKSNKLLLTEPVVLVSKLNPHIPRIWHAVPRTGHMALASTEFVALRPREGLTSEELWAACADDGFTTALSERVTGTTGSHQRIRPEDVLQVQVSDPRTASEDTRMAVRGLVDRAHSARQESLHLASLRDALLPPLLSGHLPVRQVEALVGEAV